MVHLRQQAGGVRRRGGDQRSGRRSGRRQHDGVERVAVDPPARSVGGERADGGAGADRHAPPRCGGRHGLDERRHPAKGGEEDRTARWRRLGPLTPGAEQQAAPAAGEGGQLRHHRQAEAVGVGGVDAADEGVDEALVDLVAEPATHEGADRVGGIAAREERLGGGAQLAADRQQAARRQAQEVGGHAEQQALGDRVETVEPDGGGGVRRRGQCAGEPDLGASAWRGGRGRGRHRRPRRRRAGRRTATCAACRRGGRRPPGPRSRSCRASPTPASVWATVSPVIPPPTTRTRRLIVRRRRDRRGRR